MCAKTQNSQLKSRHKEPAARNIYGTDSPPQMLYCETKVALRIITIYATVTALLTMQPEPLQSGAKELRHFCLSVQPAGPDTLNCSTYKKCASI